MESNWITIVLLTIWVTLVQGQPQYEVQVRGPIEFTYIAGSENTLADGRCCLLTEQGPPCNISCDNWIIFCFREIQHPASDTNLAVCPLGRIALIPPTMNTDIITLNATALATTTTYPGIIQLLVRIIPLPARNEDEVDSSRLTLPRIIQDRDSQLNTQGFTLPRTVVLTGGLRVVCKEGYFGPDCGCTPRDDSTGHFTCNEDGTIVCLPGYQNNDTNCMEEVITTPEPPTTNTQTNAVTTSEPGPITGPESIADINTTDLPTPTHSTTSEMGNSMATFTTDPSSENDGDIVPLVAGGVAGGLVVLSLILIVNIVLVVAVIKIKCTKHYSNKQGSTNDEDIEMGANPVYVMKGGANRPDNNTDGVYETVQ